MSDLPILVTGASGFIGRHLVAALRARGDRVRALVRSPEAAASLSAEGAETVVGDLLQEGVAARAASGVRAVFHLAGQVFVPGVPADYYTRLHVDATTAVLEAAAASQRVEWFVLCTTTGVHGPTRPGHPAREDDPPAPQNAYEMSKARAEVEAARISARLQIPLVIARPGLVYGPGDLHLAGWFRAIKAGTYRVIGTGKNKLHPIYVDDAVRAMLLMGRTSSPAARAYHVVGSEAVTMDALSSAIGRAVGRPVPGTHLPRPVAFTLGALLEMLPLARRRLPLTRSRVTFMTQNREYDGSRARDELGFAAAVDLHDGLARTVAWYRANGLL